MRKTSKKTLKRADNKSVSYRLTKEELAAVTEDLELENKGRTPTTLTAYAKHTLIDRQRHRRLEIGLRKLVDHEQRESGMFMQPPCDAPEAGRKFYAAVKALLEAP